MCVSKETLQLFLRYSSFDINNNIRRKNYDFLSQYNKALLATFVVDVKEKEEPVKVTKQNREKLSKLFSTVDLSCVLSIGVHINTNFLFEFTFICRMHTHTLFNL